MCINAITILFFCQLLLSFGPFDRVRRWFFEADDSLCSYSCEYSHGNYVGGVFLWVTTLSTDDQCSCRFEVRSISHTFLFFLLFASLILALITIFVFLFPLSPIYTCLFLIDTQLDTNVNSYDETHWSTESAYIKTHTCICLHIYI